MYKLALPIIVRIRLRSVLDRQSQVKVESARRHNGRLVNIEEDDKVELAVYRIGRKSIVTK